MVQTRYRLSSDQTRIPTYDTVTFPSDIKSFDCKTNLETNNPNLLYLYVSILSNVPLYFCNSKIIPSFLIIYVEKCKLQKRKLKRNIKNWTSQSAVNLRFQFPNKYFPFKYIRFYTTLFKNSRILLFFAYFFPPYFAFIIFNYIFDLINIFFNIRLIIVFSI